MDPNQDPEALELFKAELARRVFDPTVPADEIEVHKTLAAMVNEGLLLVEGLGDTWGFRPTALGEKMASRA